MDQQEARDILKGCGGCILGLIVLLVGAILFFGIAYGVLCLVSHYEEEWPPCMTHLLRMPKFSGT